MDRYLIANTTREEREQIVRDALGYSDIGCEAENGYDMYIPYIDGEKELREITMEYRTNYVQDEEYSKAEQLIQSRSADCRR